MKASDRSAISVVVAVVLSSFTLLPLTSDGSYLGVTWLLVIVIGGLSLLLRRLGVGSLVVLLAQLAFWAGFVIVVSSRMPVLGENVLSRVIRLFEQAAEHMRVEAAPMSPDNGVKLLFVTAIGLIAIMTDLLVLGVRRPVWAIAPPATLYLIPAVGLSSDIGAGPFLLIALGYIGILIAEGLNSNARWTRGLSRDSADQHGSADPVVWRAAAYIGLPAMMLAVIFGLLLPTFTLNGIGIGNGPGGNGPLQLADPTLDLKRNLNLPTDRPVLTYRTNNDDGLYLRLASLPSFSRAGWQNTQTPIERTNQLPDVPGLSDAETPNRHTTITVGDFASEYLPMPYAPRSFDAPGEWGVDPNSLVVISASRQSSARSSATRNLSYTVESVDTTPDARRLADAAVGTPVDSAITSEIPSDLPADLIALSRQVTAKADTPADKAAAIQAFLRDTDNFRYDTRPQPGSGYQALENFLLSDKRGYCEQFAASMAMMARVVGIPSRVAVGFLPGDRNGDTWTVSARDMHAWPELYFQGLGWVRYEPTPGSVTGTPPSWTVRQQNNPSDDNSAEPSASASQTSAAPSTRPSSEASQAPTAPTQSPGVNWGRTLLIGGVALLVLLILAAPASIRVRRRSQRYDPAAEPADRVESAWSEVRDTVIDLGGTWPAGSPRRIGDQVGERLDPSESAAIGQLAVMVERSRYARDYGDPTGTEELPQLTDGIRRGLAEPQPRLRRALAWFLPRSLFRRPR